MSQPSKEKLLAASIEGNVHELGIRMVADFFEMDGWDTHYLGADTPSSEIVDSALKHRPSVLAVSVALDSQVGRLRKLIEDLRAQADLQALKIIVGGYGLQALPGGQRDVGADAYGSDAAEALRVANEIRVA